MALAEHRARAPSGIRCAVITVSDTRTPETDESGKEARFHQGCAVSVGLIEQVDGTGVLDEWEE